MFISPYLVGKLFTSVQSLFWFKKIIKRVKLLAHLVRGHRQIDLVHRLQTGTEMGGGGQP